MKKTFLAVSQDNRWLSLKPNESGYWCSYKSHEVAPKDLVAMYRPGKGIFQIYEVTNTSIDTEVECKVRKMLTIPTKLIVQINNPLTAREMKTDPIIAKATFVGRNFQGTTFPIDDVVWNQLVKNIVDKNPDLVDSLVSIL